LKNEIINPLVNTGEVVYEKYSLFPPRDKIHDDIIKSDNIVLVEGFGALNINLTDYYDLKIWVDLNVEISIERALDRDLKESGTRQDRIESVKNFWIFWKKIIKNRIKNEKPSNLADIVISTENYYKIIKNKFQHSNLKTQ
jgi:uridine kinase